MPTYVCSVPPGSLTDNQKGQIAQAISKRHGEATGAPTYYVQVEIEESPIKQRFLGGTLTDAHIWVRGDIRAGRSETARQQLILDIAEDVSRIAAVKKRDVWVYVCNLAPTDMVEYGHVLPKPGEEAVWFQSLPYELQTYLKGLGTNKETLAQ